MSFKDYLRLFRAQTAPATVILVVTPFLHGGGSWLDAFLLGVFALAFHWWSFGMNSLQDYVGGWDKVDPSKAHHPLSRGAIKVEDGIRVIHWGLPILFSLGVLFSLRGVNPLWALACWGLFYAWAMSYNMGLSKVSVLGFMPISVCFTMMGGWAWFLSHDGLGFTGWVWLGYVFSTILFQISWSGHLKELEIRERGNLLVKLGARLEVQGWEVWFKPGYAAVYGWAVKLLNLFLGYVLLIQSWNLWRILLFGLMATLMLDFLSELTKRRVYDRPRELLNMSLEEISTIYLALIMVEPFEALVLGGFGVAYFFLFNRWLWRTAYPKV